MNRIKLFYIIFATTMVLIAGCTQSRQNSNEDLEFKDLCRQSGNQWMKMQPTENGKFIRGAEECFGCMVGLEHVCDKEKFNDFVLG